MKDTPVRSENRTGVSDCSETNCLSGPQRAELISEILLQNDFDKKRPYDLHCFKTFSLMHKNLCTG